MKKQNNKFEFIRSFAISRKQVHMLVDGHIVYKNSDVLFQSNGARARANQPHKNNLNRQFTATQN